jgi:hypothetical protein
MRVIPYILAIIASLVAVSSSSAQVARLTTSEATLMPNSRTVHVESGYLPGDGLIIVRDVKDGRIASASLGVLSVPSGEIRAIDLKLSRSVVAGEILLLTLHADQGRRGVYDSDPLVLSVEIPPVVTRRAAQRG